MIKIGDGLDLMTAGISKMPKEEVERRLKFLWDDEMRLFSRTRDADFEEYDAIERAMERNRQKQKVLRERLKELQGA